MEPQLHDFQALILRELLFNPGARFRDLNKTGVTNDHFTFHLKRLITEGLITKQDSGYHLTQKGKEFANRLDTDTLKIERQAKTGVALHAVRKTGNQIQYLIHHRLKEPFYGWYGSHSGKIRWGETPLQTARREFFEETGLTGDFSLKGIVHYHHFFTDGHLLEDKYFWVVRVDNPQGELKEKVPEGENIWMSESEIRKLNHIFATFDEMVEVINSSSLVYVERQRVVDNY